MTINYTHKFEEAFRMLNDRLKDEDESLHVTCAGGFVLSHYGLRTTKDVDGFFVTNRKINAIIKDIGDILGLNTEDELWLNNSIQNLNAVPKEDICEVLYDFSNLKVIMPPLEYMAGMKLTSARGQDIKDVAAIIRILKTEDPLGFADNLTTLGFFRIDESLILEAFGEAYGMEWLEKYFTDHEADILARL